MGTNCWFLYSLIRQHGEEYLDDKWEIKNDAASGDALVCSYDFSKWRHRDIFASESDIAGAMVTLRAEEWVYDWRLEDSVVYAVVGFYGENIVYALDDLVHRARLIQVKRKPKVQLQIAIPVNSPRKDRIKQSIAEQKEVSNVIKERNDKRLLVRLQAKWSERYGYSGDDWGDARWRDKDSPFGVTMNLEGLWHLYEMLFEKRFNRKSSLYTRGKPNKAAFSLKAIVGEYDIEYAMAGVVYAIENWEEIQKITRIAKPPAPSVIFNLRHELCHPLTQDKDPLEELRKVKGGYETLETKLQRDEYKQDDEDKEVGW